MAELEDDAGERETRFKEKHSLDSDEEDDDGKKYDVLAEDDIEGQEEATVDFDEDTPIMPFNMREEMEEGHFDADGMYIFDKTKEIKDNWIDNIDWVQVKHMAPGDADNAQGAKRSFNEESDSSGEEEDEDEKKANTMKTYGSILEIVKEGETVAKAIRRLGKNKSKIPSASQRWKLKKQKTSGSAGAVDEASIELAMAEQKQMMTLTDLCNDLLQKGIMDIYETSYERISFTLKQMKEKEQKSRLTIADGVDDDDALDMFADDFDSKNASKGDAGTEESTANSNSNNDTTQDFKKPTAPSDPTESIATAASTDGVLWEYKESDTEDADIKGPFTTTQMSQWSDDGTFANGVLCRKYKSDGQFYNSARLDFDLYDE